MYMHALKGQFCKFTYSQPNTDKKNFAYWVYTVHIGTLILIY